ncbi:MAG: hypothetical protein K2Q23_03375, partial [Bryobacteraceae bacterium]|nr:hypothetical protein [Bryobacteraceae bacterium]
MEVGDGVTKKRWWIAAVLAVGAWQVYRAEFWHAERFRERIQMSLERGLGRRVQLQGEIRYNVLTGPGFQMDDVVIHEDPAHGREPIAYVSTLEARVSWMRLLRGELVFGTLRMDEPSINVSRGGAAGVNVAPLVEKALQARGRGTLPDVVVRGGRINFVLNKTKSVFYLRGVDLEFTPLDDTSFEVRFEGEPARADRRAVGFGRFSARGKVRFPRGREPEVDVSVDLDRSNAAEVASLFEPRAVHLDGRLSTEARVRGPLSRVEIEGKLAYDPTVKQDLVPLRSRALPLSYRGWADVREQTLRIDALPADNPNFRQIAIRFRSREILQNPRWAALVTFENLEAAPALDAWRGAGIAAKLGLDGQVSGAFGWANGVGRGMMELSTKAGARVEEADWLVDGGRIEFGARGRDVDVPSVRSVMADVTGAAPGFLADLGEGRVEGELRYRAGSWSGRFALSGATVKVQGVADPVRIERAAVEVEGERLTATGMSLKVGKLAVEGSYRYEPGAAGRHRMDLAAVEAESGEVERLFAPALERPGGIVAR